MEIIYADDAKPLVFGDIAKLLLNARDVRSIITFVHGCHKTEGFFGDAAKGAMLQALAGPTQAAIARLCENVPEDIAEWCRPETLTTGGRLIWLADEAGNFCCIARDDARIGTAAEFYNMFRLAASAAARSIPTYEAAVIAQSLSKSTLRVVN